MPARIRDEFTGLPPKKAHALRHPEKAKARRDRSDCLPVHEAARDRVVVRRGGGMTRASRTGPAPRHDYAAVLPGMLAESAKLAAVAERLGVAEATVMHHAKRLGLEPMTPKERRKERVMAMFAAGDCINAIAAVVGCHRSTVINLLSAAGVYRPDVERKRLMSRADRIRLRAAPP